MDIQFFAKLGLKRDIPELLPNHGTQLEMCPGKSPSMLADFSIDYPSWNADYNSIKFQDNTFDVIHAYHCFEHFMDPVKVLRECWRVLKIGGHINIVVPHCKSELAFEDLDHSQYFHEDSIPKLLRQEGYEKYEKINLKVHANFLLGVAYRNLCIFTQLVKESNNG